MEGLELLGADDIAVRRRNYTYRGAAIGGVLANFGLFLFGWKFGIKSPREPFQRFLVATTTGAATGAGAGYVASRLTEK